MAKPFAVSKFKITYYNWIGCVESGFCPAAIRSLALATPTAPVRGLSWFDAKEYVKWLSLKTGRRYRLLTKAEWDYMARAGHAADGRAAKANLGELKVQPPDGRSFVSGASMSVANPWGIFEIDGRYVEWVEDCDRSSADLESELYEPYGPYEPYEPHGEAAYEPGAADPRASCPRRYVRGGPARTAATDKTSEPADSHDLIITLRVARDL